ncbi:TPA: hypothetical protein L4657_006059 [Pseudomonas aeruginosa]|nr:hypothetical protein [Pseudomonas aeruginosa]
MVDKVAARAATTPLSAAYEEARHALVHAGMPRHILVVDQVPAGQGPALASGDLAAVVAHRTDPHDQPGASLQTPLGRHLAVDAEHGSHGQSQELEELELQLLEESDPDQLEELSAAKLLEQLTERRSSSSTADISSAWLMPNGSPWCTGVE